MSLPPDERNPAGGPGFDDNFDGAGASKSYHGHQRPRAGTARAAILAALEKGRILTSLVTWREYGASRLAADIHTLRAYGWPILAQRIEVTARSGRRASIAEYWLRPEGLE